MNAKSVKTIRKVEKPRPLRNIADVSKFDFSKESITPKRSISDVLPELERIYIELCNTNFDEKTAENIAQICSILKTHGQELDLSRKNMIDHYFVTLRNVSREERLDAVSRLRLLELIEIKAMGWQINENLLNYYRRKNTDFEGTEKAPMTLSQSQSCSSLISQAFPEHSSPIPVPLAPGEILRSSGKFMNPTKIAGKNYFKDEVVIRNSDSGKVMGIKGRRVHMIEELSDTIISFQRVNPGARDRRVQIAGPNEESISFAKTLVEDTIRRNASPVRERNDNANIQLNNCINMMSSLKMEDQDLQFPKPLMHSFSMADTANEYMLNVQLFGENIKLTGKNLELLQFAKSLLQENFSAQELPHSYLRSTSLQANLSNFRSDAVQRNSLQRSLSCNEAFNGCSQTSISPFDTSSEEETSKDGDNLFKAIGVEEAPPFAYQLLGGIDNIPPPIPPPRRMYTRDTLMRMRHSPLCKILPQIDPEIWTIYPMMLKDNVLVQSSETNQGSIV